MSLRSFYELYYLQYLCQYEIINYISLLHNMALNNLFNFRNRISSYVRETLQDQFQIFFINLQLR